MKYSLNCHGASVSWLGSMVSDLLALQVMSISRSRGISLDSNDQRPSIHPTVANKFNVSFFCVFYFNLTKEMVEKRSREECPKRVLKLGNNKKKFD